MEFIAVPQDIFFPKKALTPMIGILISGSHAKVTLDLPYNLKMYFLVTFCPGNIFNQFLTKLKHF